MRLIAILLLAALPASAQTAEAELKPIINEMLATVAAGDTAPWKKYLDDRMVYVSEANEVQTKAQLLADFRPLPKGLVGTLQVGDDFKVEQHGTVAIVVMTANERLDYHGQVLNTKYRMTDTWQKTPDGWRLLARQVLAVLFDPSAITLPHDTLCTYNGTYRLSDDISTKVTCMDSGLQSERTGRKAVTQKAEAMDVFFEPGQPRSRRIFQRDAKGNITGFADRREGVDIVWKKVDGK